MNYIMEPDPVVAAHDNHCQGCGSSDIEFVKVLGTFPCNVTWNGKPCQRVKKLLWLCNTCGRSFTSNEFITQ